MQENFHQLIILIKLMIFVGSHFVKNNDTR